ncbi:hypothetical protein [Aquimarina sp. AU474]|uniref:hypothetical protein n=1 Tax=Aquimarina sp. AU474 TaxID=2108529 RepID=UPI000D69E460|nr:hypothetical protein [Aquimarina sp. AU474]
MKDDQLKKIIQKSTIETSDDFLNNLMHTIENQKNVKKSSLWWSFKSVLIACTLLVTGITFLTFIYLGNTTGSISFEIPKTPIFIIITTLLLLAVNHVIRVNENYGKIAN